MDRLAQILDQIAALASEAQALAGGAPPAIDQTYPRIVTIDGAAIELHAPIAPDWIPSMAARELTRYGSFGSEPSNGGQFGQPLRSPAGYPLVYVPDGFGGVRETLVNYDGVNFRDDLAIAVYKKAVAERNAANARAGGTFSPATGAR